ncbi:hypothetical protein B9Z55_019314 [Caenorhabditis nigoni]|uniref:Uncharacterized protein n=1 Tax=Caenorhabditis nigoni TaxID=1611254 RepID=A0A2G5THW0_9PELO|nr:hypothetical protein B9Z55_019314 [Caenorhabditis nigoni]
MPSIWSKIKEYWQWFLWGKTPYHQLSDEMKRDARRDLYCRLFVIANAPYFATVYGTFAFSMAVATKMGDILLPRVPEKESCRKSVGGMCFAVYIVLHFGTFDSKVSSHSHRFDFCPNFKMEEAWKVVKDHFTPIFLKPLKFRDMTKEQKNEALRDATARVIFILLLPYILSILISFSIGVSSMILLNELIAKLLGSYGKFFKLELP